jgi:hypothetical protein
MSRDMFNISMQCAIVSLTVYMMCVSKHKNCTLICFIKKKAQKQQWSHSAGFGDV